MTYVTITLWYEVNEEPCFWTLFRNILVETGPRYVINWVFCSLYVMSLEQKWQVDHNTYCLILCFYGLWWPLLLFPNSIDQCHSLSMWLALSHVNCLSVIAILWLLSPNKVSRSRIRNVLSKNSVYVDISFFDEIVPFMSCPCTIYLAHL